jgi:hypothetical protein
VITDPPGAKIVINREDRGKSNAVVSGECKKNYNVTLALEGYEDVEENIVFRERKGRLARSLKKVPMGSVELTVDQNAQLFIDGLASGEVTAGTPLQKSLRSGRTHKLRFINKVFKLDETCSVSVQTDKVERRIIKLGEGRCKP